MDAEAGARTTGPGARRAWAALLCGALACGALVGGVSACAGISPAEHQRAVAEAERPAEHARRRAEAERGDEAAGRRVAEAGLDACRHGAAAQLARITLTPDLARRAIERWPAADAVRAGRPTPALMRAVDARAAERGADERVVLRLGPGVARAGLSGLVELVERLGARLVVDASQDDTVEVAVERGP